MFLHLLIAPHLMLMHNPLMLWAADDVHFMMEEETKQWQHRIVNL